MGDCAAAEEEDESNPWNEGELTHVAVPVQAVRVQQRITHF